MNNYDDIFTTQPGNEGFGEQPFDKEAWAEKKQEERKAVYELADKTAEAVGADGGKYREYLDVQAKFDRYSATNALLILAQMPRATLLKDFNGWREAGIYVKKKAQGVSILEPGNEYQREDGTIGTSYNVKKVFDLSQTTTKVKGQPAASVDDRLLLRALIHKPPVPIQIVDALPDNMGAWYDHGQQAILVRRGMAAEDIFRSVSKEIAHAQLAAENKDYTREAAAFTAYSVSYILCKKNGIDVSGYTFDQLPEPFKEADPQGVRAALTEIRDTASEISARMFRVLDQNKAPKTKEQER